jgi:hypothetical protein
MLSLTFEQMVILRQHSLFERHGYTDTKVIKMIHKCGLLRRLVSKSIKTAMGLT